MPIAQQSLARDENGAGAPVEIDQRRDHMVELCDGKLAGKNGMFERLAFVEPPHHHQPIDRVIRPADLQTARGACQRHDRLVDVGRQPAVQRQFGAASGFALGKRRIIQIGKAHRLLQLVNLVAGQEDPGHVGLLALEVARRVRVSIRLAEKSDLVGERNRRGGCACGIRGRRFRLRQCGPGQCASANLEVIYALHLTLLVWRRP